MVDKNRPRLDPNDVVLSESQAVALRKIVARLSRRLRTLKLPGKLTPERLNVLGTVISKAPISLTALSQMERVTTGTMSRAVAALEESGFVRCREDKDDRRAILITSSAKGRRAHDQAHGELLAQVVEAICHLDGEQLETLRTLLLNIENRAKGP